jgi:EAL domain-containing protein (putative c-di-GMP-specific phosphodiesterase class I)
MRGHVLIVDDEEDLAAWMAEVLSGAGLNASPVSEASEAMALLRNGGFDVVVSDIMMPGMDGIQLLGAVHALDPDLPVMLVTGKPTLDSAIRALDLGAVQYLLKPVSADDLEAAVARALRMRLLAKARRDALGYLARHRRTGGRRLALSAALDRAIKTLWIAYQPVLRAEDESVYGYEALLRSEEEPFLRPIPLLDAAERLGRVPEVSRIVRNTVATAITNGGLGDTVFVNMHALDLLDEHLTSPDSPLSAHAGHVILEITERAGLEEIPNVRARVRALRSLGYRIAIDDLGAGYAGLSSFVALEPDVVKLDASLVHGVSAQPMKQKLMRSMADLGRELGILTVAEGIETAEERDMARSLGCDLLQGFFLGLPVSRSIEPVAR